MDIDQRKKIIDEKLATVGETINSWSKKNGLDHRLVIDLINGKLRGTRGITLNARSKIEDYFGCVFDE